MPRPLESRQITPRATVPRSPTPSRLDGVRPGDAQEDARFASMVGAEQCSGVLPRRRRDRDAERRTQCSAGHCAATSTSWAFDSNGPLTLLDEPPTKERRPSSTSLTSTRATAMFVVPSARRCAEHHRVAGGRPERPYRRLELPDSGELRLTPDMVSPGVAFSPDGSHLYASRAGPTAQSDLATGGLVRRLGGRAACVSPDGQHLAVGTVEGGVLLLDTRTGEGGRDPWRPGAVTGPRPRRWAHVAAASKDGPSRCGMPRPRPARGPRGPCWGRPRRRFRVRPPGSTASRATGALRVGSPGLVRWLVARRPVRPTRTETAVLVSPPPTRPSSAPVSSFGRRGNRRPEDARQIGRPRRDWAASHRTVPALPPRVRLRHEPVGR